jgi:hypothetical protein
MKKYLSLFLIIISASGYILAQNGACNVATNFTANLSLNPQNYPTTDSTLWFNFKTDSAAIRILVNVDNNSPVMPFNIKRITLYSGVCDTLNLVNFTSPLSTVNHRLSLTQLNLDTTLLYYVKITRQYQPFCGNCDTGLVNLNIKMQELNLRMPVGGWPQAFQDSCTFSQCENLVCNGGFELHDSLNDGVTGSTNFSVAENDVFSWLAYNDTGAVMNTPDYYNTNQGIANFQVPNLPAMGAVNHLPPMNGFIGTYDGYTGFATSINSNPYREALHQALNAPLLPNRSYFCSYWIRLAPGSDRICNNPVAMYLTPNASYNTDYDNVVLGNIAPALSYTELTPLANPEWLELRTCFTPTDTLRSLFMLSSHERANQVDASNLNQNPSIATVGYYFVDNVMVRPMAYISALDTVHVKNCGSINLGTCAIPNGIDELGNTLDYFSYHWQVIDSLTDFSSGAPILSDTSTSEINILVYSNTTLALSVYHIDTLSGDTICIDRDTVTVLPDPECCLLQAQEQYLDSVIWAYQASGLSYNFNSTTMSINGDFILNHPNYSTVNIIGTEIVFGPKGRIVVPPTITLNIEDSYLHGCSEMWNGIVVSGDLLTPNLNIINSVIEDADTAIHFMPTATGLHLVGNIFNKNYVDIVTSGVNNFPQIQEISNNTFNCQDGVAAATYTPNGLRIPRNGMRSAIAIRAFDANSQTPATAITLTVGANINTGNNFFNHDFGILTTNLNLNAAFNTFKNVNDNSINTYTFTTPKGINIQCDNTNGSNLGVILGDNTFNNGLTAIDIRAGLDARIERNEIYEMSNFGIVFIENNNKSFRISANIIDNVAWVGIYGLNNPNSVININQNQIFNTSNSLWRTGIALDELTAPIVFGYNSQVMGNTITNLQYGITHTSIYNPRIFSNTITIQQTPWANYSHGIRLFNCSKSHIRGNTIYGNNRDEYFVDGIRLDNGIGGGQIDCNYTVKTGSGVFFTGASITSSNLYSNVFLKNFWGVVVANDASIGSQYNTLTSTSRANQWTGAMPNPDYAHTLAYSADGTLSPFYTLTGYPWQPIVNDVGGTGPIAVDWFPVYNNQSHNCVLYRPDLDTALFIIAPGGGGVDENELMMQINNTDFNQNSASSSWWSKASAYTQLKTNDNLVPANNDLVVFKDSADLATLGKFTEIDKSLGDSLAANIDSLKIVNNIISTNNIIEDLIKALNSIKMDYLKFKAITAIQFNQLREIAALCPHADGPAVYSARALLRGLDNQRQEYMNECEKVYPASSSNRESAPQIEYDNNLFSKGFAVSPNPAQSNVAVTHYGNFQSLKITEISGKMILESKLNTSINIENINVSYLANGVYILILIADNKTERIKLVINK